MGSCASTVGATTASSSYVALPAECPARVYLYPSQPIVDPTSPLDSALSALLCAYGCLLRRKNLSKEPVSVSRDMKEALHCMLYSVCESKESFCLFWSRRHESMFEMEDNPLWLLVMIAASALGHHDKKTVALVVPQVNAVAFQHYVAPLCEFLEEFKSVFHLSVSFHSKVNELIIGSTETCRETLRLLFLDETNLVSDRWPVDLAFTVVHQTARCPSDALRKIVAYAASVNPVFIVQDDFLGPDVTASLKWLPTYSSAHGWKRNDVLTAQLAHDSLISEKASTVDAIHKRMAADQYNAECQRFRRMFVCARDFINPEIASSSTASTPRSTVVTQHLKSM